MMRRITSVIAAACFVAGLPASQTPASAAVGEGTVTISTSESWACEQPSTDGSYASRTGLLPDSQMVGGPRADLLGRSIGEIRGSLVWWTMPMSGGYKVLIHERALPAFNRAAANLAAEQAKGNYYAIKPTQTFAFAPRTISGRYQISLHGHGIAVDINSASNPYSSSGTLITNMPGWFVNAWKDAGFCWGGDWTTSKDPMHFSWKGTLATPGYGDVPEAYPVDTGPAGYSDVVMSTQTEFGAPGSENEYLLGDGDGDGLADVFQLVPRDNGTRLEYSQSDRNHDWCAIGRDHALDVTVGDRIALLGDYSRVGRNDLFLLDTSGTMLSIEVSLKPTGFAESKMIATDIPVITGDTYLLGDDNRDGYADLYVIHHGVESTTLEIYSGEDDFATLIYSADTGLGATTGSLFTLGDRDLDELPDLFVITPAGSLATVSVLSNGYTSRDGTFTVDVNADLMDVLVNDYDGDGRGDLWLWDETGTLTVRLGNTPIPGVTADFWHNSPNWECDPDSPPYYFNGTFRDDDEDIHEANIEIIAEAGVTKGCNPPFNDDYCPGAYVTRGEMAAFLVRALELTDDGGRDWFSDDDDSVFEGDINMLAAAGVTVGCNPPDNSLFCPNDHVSRAQMAAFLVRGLGLTEGSGDDWFIDDDASIFEYQIDRLARSGITVGCNPPANDRFCPLADVRRDTMASFIARALPLIDS
jgi:hypothetical protein